MTTINTTTQAEEPEWMRVRREIGNGYLDPVTDDTAQDIDYLMARLRRILDRTEQVGSLRYLPEDIEQLITELRPHGRAGDAAFAQLQATYPGLFWNRIGGKFVGMPRAYRRDSDSAAAEQCAAELGLVEAERTPQGRRDWRGIYADLPVRVLGAPAAEVAR
ncbi:hypothetical protein [Nocardia sp. SC052]|uniref:hypothetical protein n=1 Tax=Nocardia sichangensis TaxID=3385975 RepID=UPI00399F20A3